MSDFLNCITKLKDFLGKAVHSSCTKKIKNKLKRISTSGRYEFQAVQAIPAGKFGGKDKAHPGVESGIFAFFDMMEIQLNFH